MCEKTKVLHGVSRWKICSMILLFIVSIFAHGVAMAQGGEKVSGQVLDESGQPLPGVTVMIKDTSKGAITDIDGNYELTVNKGDVLVFSFIGYKKMEVPADGRSQIAIQLELDIEALEEVVVVGFGEQKKESVVGSIVTTPGETVVKSGGVTTVSEALAGVLPGVAIQQNAGIPGASQANIFIRGRASWTNVQPLILVDGIERDMNNIDPNEIESVTVLKDGSATAVFGARAANGAIIITTKTGQKGKVKVNFAANFGMKVPTTNTDLVASMPDNLRAMNQALINDREFDGLRPEQEIAMWENPDRDLDQYSYTNWVKELLGKGYSQSYNLNLSGGNDKVTYYTSFGYNYDGDLFDLKKQPDYDPRTWQKRYNYRTNVDFNVTKSTVVSAKIAGQIVNWNGNNVTAAGGANGFSDGDGEGRALYLEQFYNWPTVGPGAYYTRDVDGKPVRFYSIEDGVAENSNYLVRMQHSGAVTKQSNRLWTDFGVKQDLSKIVEGLKLRAKLSYNSFVEYQQNIDYSTLQYEHNVTQYGLDENGQVILILDGKDPQAVQKAPELKDEELKKFDNNIYYEGGIDYNNTFGLHSVSALALFYRQENTNLTAKYKFPTKLESWVGRTTYNYDERYFVEANGAYNGSDKFERGSRYGFFPSGAVGWMVSNESFMDATKGWLDHFKIRYSYGIVGIENNAQRWVYLGFYERVNNDQIIPYYGQGKNKQATVQEAQIPVSGATWEEATKQNLGFEFGFLDSKLTFNTELYKESREGIFYERKNTVSTFAGFRSKVYANNGETRSQGLEFDVQWRDVINTDLSYWVKANLGISQNQVVSRDDPSGASAYQKEAGKPIGAERGLLIDSYLDDLDEVYNTTKSSYDAELIPGDFQYVDYNADGVIDNDDRVVINYPSIPSHVYGFSGSINYKGIGFMARFSGVYNIAKGLSKNFLWANETRSILKFQLNNNEQRDAWSPDNKDAAHPSLHVANNHNSQTSEYSVRNASYLKLQTAEVSYRLPKSMLKGVNSLEVYANGNNLWTWSNIPDEIDPESRKLEVYPIARRYNVGFRLSF